MTFLRKSIARLNIELEQANGSSLLQANNLSDVSSVVTARSNILPSKTGNALKVLRVNAGETDYELATISGGSGLEQYQVRRMTRR